MDISLFLAQVFGIYLTIAGIGLALKPKTLTKFVHRFSSNRLDVMMGGFLALLIGTPLVLIHNIWAGTWEVLVTGVVWLVFLKGVLLVLIPDVVLEMAQKLEHNRGMVKAMLWVMTVIGLYLLYVGFLM